MAYSNSPLVDYTRLSPMNSGTRTYPISRITPHHVVGLLSVEAIGAEFCGTRQASSNYGIGADGRVGLYVPESCRSWASSSWDNDQKAVTIECSDYPYEPYTFPDVVYNKLVDLCVDICRRNGKKKLLWLGTKEKCLAYQPKDDEMVLTMHKFFLATKCPGTFMEARMGDLAQKVTARLGSEEHQETEGNTVDVTLPILQKGSKEKTYVKTLQTLLIAKGYNCGGYGVDGDFGNGTLSSVKAFQKKCGLTADGVVGKQTWETLLKF